MAYHWKQIDLGFDDRTVEKHYLFPDEIPDDDLCRSDALATVEANGDGTYSLSLVRGDYAIPCGEDYASATDAQQAFIAGSSSPEEAYKVWEVILKLDGVRGL
jgi:hypothetical protein